MSDGLSNVACFSMTTLLVVSLANLTLLIIMIMEARKKCQGDETSDNTLRFGALKGSSQYSSLIDGKNNRENPRFMAALTLLKANSMTLICGTVIISKSWVLTAAHCCESIKTYPFEKLKIASNSENWRKGKKHSVESVVRHSNYTARSSSFDVCLIKSGSPFKELHEQPISLASSSYKYIHDTSATTIGWSSKRNVVSNILYVINVNLISFQRCKTLVKNDRVDETMVCAYNIDNNDCSFDSGGPLIQNNIVIGIVSFELDCTKRMTPRTFTRISYFEKWFETVEKQNSIELGLVFKP